jgi:hypothetical protein
MDIGNISRIQNIPLNDISKVNNILKANISSINRYPIGSLPFSPSPPSWNPFFDNNYWEPSLGESCYWDSTAVVWVSGPFYLQTDVIGTWQLGFRPTQIRITSTSPIENIVLHDSTLGPPFLVNAYQFPGSTVRTENITYYGNDIGMLFVTIENGGAFVITNIEFYG